MKIDLLPENTTVHIIDWTDYNAIDIHYPVKDIEGTYKVGINYPLGKPTHFMFDIDESSYFVNDLLDEIYEVYNQIYMNPKKFEVWGHAFGDLYIEGLILDTDKKEILLQVGS